MSHGGDDEVHEEHEEHVNHEAWVIPYADLLTLLMAMFIALFAMSTVDVTKFKAFAIGLVVGVVAWSSRPARSSVCLTSFDCTMISTRRFLARPSAVAFDATGWSSPFPDGCKRSAEIPSRMKYSATDPARSSDRKRFDGNCAESIGWLSVYPLIWIGLSIPFNT